MSVNNTTLPTVGETATQVSLKVPYILLELVIALLSSVGNLLVCVAVAKNRRLRTVTNYFLVSLAVADVCVGAVAIPCAIMTDLGLPHHSFLLCVLMLSVLIMLTQSSIFSLLAVAIDRYVAIFSPFRYKVIMTHRNALLTIVLTWLVAFLIGLLPAMGWHKASPRDDACYFVDVIDMNYMVYFNFFGCVLTPLLIMFVIYARIFLQVRKQLRRIANETRGGTANGQEPRMQSLKKEVKTATSLFLVLFLFTVCWIPLHVLNCISLLCPGGNTPSSLLLVAIILSHANSAVNPFLYAYRMKSYRRAFLSLIMCRGARSLNDDNQIAGTTVDIEMPRAKLPNTALPGNSGSGALSLRAETH